MKSPTTYTIYDFKGNIFFYSLNKICKDSTISSELSFIGFLMDLVVEPPSPLKIRKRRRKLLTTMVGVREEDTIKGNDEICTLGLSGVYLIYLKYRKKEENLRKKRVDDFTSTSRQNFIFFTPSSSRVQNRERRIEVVKVDSPKTKKYYCFYS
ncbi:hypothetical protein H8356DRAFT_1353429 [Neocallimastix lanati (nom. inval.)]|nr:hypothetical protein H8356DRAFT_1353429 [Neocallimastix sp. JGI-2020a]